MENQINVMLNKKLSDYNYSVDNIRVVDELMVTITLNEYRNLVSQAAERETADMRSKWCDEHNKVLDLTKKLENTQETILAMQKEIASLKVPTATAETLIF